MPKSHLLKGLSPALRRRSPSAAAAQFQTRSVHITRELTRSKETPTPAPAPHQASPFKASVISFPNKTFAIRRGSLTYNPEQKTPGPLRASPCQNPAHRLPIIHRAYGPKLAEEHFGSEPQERLGRALDHRMDMRDLDCAALRHDVAFKLGVEYLSPAQHKVSHKRERLLDGYVHGLRRPRVVVPAVVAAGEGVVPRWVFFVVDGTTPWSFLSKQAMEKLGIEPAADGSPAHVTISGYDQRVHQSPAGSGFEELSVLGTGFMRQYNAYQTVDWRTRAARVYINRGGMPHFSELRMTSWTPAGNVDLQGEEKREAEAEPNSEREAREAWVRDRGVGEGEDEDVGHAEMWRRKWAGTEWEAPGLFREE